MSSRDEMPLMENEMDLMPESHRPEPAGQKSRRVIVAVAVSTFAAFLLLAIKSGVAEHKHGQLQTTIQLQAFAGPQYIAALGDPSATSGTGAEQWGLWRLDPGPRGVMLDSLPQLQAASFVAPSGWQFDGEDWWLEEHGLIMEKPDMPLPAGRYYVTGGREVEAWLTVGAPNQFGAQWWSLEGATLYDVTHLPCRAARYVAGSGPGSCSPASALQGDFPVVPGGDMPPVPGCSKQDYHVLVVEQIA